MQSDENHRWQGWPLTNHQFRARDVRYSSDKPESRDPGYLAKIERCHARYAHWFGFTLWSGQAVALVAAQKWRDEQSRRLEPLTKQEFISQIRINNTSGAVGVLQTTQRSKKRSGRVWSIDYWVARHHAA